MKKLFAILFTLVGLAHANAIEFKPVPDWLKVPETRTQLGDMHGDLAVSSKGEVYVSMLDPKTGLQVFGPDGKFLRNVPGAPNDFHGFVIRKQADGEFIFGSRLQGQSIIKMTLDGKVVLEIPASSIPDEFKKKAKDGKPTLRLTGMDVAPNGDLYVTDGYASDYIHRFDRTGKYLASFGGKKEPYSFKTLHKLVIDTRFSPARILACDRANMRVVHLSLDGEFLGVYAKDLLNPAAVAIHGDYAAIGEIKGRVTVLDRSGQVVAQFGLTDKPEEAGTNKTEPAKWRPGIVTAPHGIAFNEQGDIFVAEYNIYGRVHRFNRNEAAQTSNNGWERLFNGKDLTGWYVHVNGKEKNSDPTKIVQVTDGMIHMYASAEPGSKQPTTVVCTEKDYANYDLRFEYKWGTKKFAPRVDKKRDAGLLYHCYDERVWPSSVECQIQEGDVGDTFVVRSQIRTSIDPNKTNRVFLPEQAGGVMQTFGNPEGVVGIRKSHVCEKEGWNTVEVKIRGDSAIHIINGQTNNMVFSMAKVVDGKSVPLTKG
ncbi:MAG: repeat containing protein, partial [Verrucomicrobiales bacterium]|nr:repeat containing protein [Verrucomicrobiales bacterium]